MLLKLSDHLDALCCILDKMRPLPLVFLLRHMLLYQWFLYSEKSIEQLQDSLLSKEEQTRFVRGLIQENDSYQLR